MIDADEFYGPTPPRRCQCGGAIAYQGRGRPHVRCPKCEAKRRTESLLRLKAWAAAQAQRAA